MTCWDLCEHGKLKVIAEKSHYNAMQKESTNVILYVDEEVSEYLHGL